MAHPEECVHVGLHRAPARPSFSIIAVPHMVLYDCPSSCPTAEHMLVPSMLNWGEKGFYSVFQIQLFHSVFHIRSLMWTG